MKSDPQFGIASQRRLIYQPVVVKAREGGYSADEVNAFLLDVEQEFEGYLRQTEDRIVELQASLRRRHDELGKLANLADSRAAEESERRAQLEADMRAAETRLAEEAAARHAAEEAQAQLQAALDTARQETEARQRDIAWLKEALASMQRSTSWRITGPLRGISRLVRRR